MLLIAIHTSSACERSVLVETSFGDHTGEVNTAKCGNVFAPEVVVIRHRQLVIFLPYTADALNGQEDLRSRFYPDVRRTQRAPDMLVHSDGFGLRISGGYDSMVVVEHRSG